MSALSDEKSPSGNPPKDREDISRLTIDRYKLEALIGAGGMGRVYSAVHSVTKRRCALKLLPDELCRQPNFVSRFHTEAQTLARLNQPNIVQIYTGGESAGKFFLEMEYIDGGDLQKRVVDHVASTGLGLPEAEVTRLTDGILAALEYAHGHGVIHRDLKPANILLSKSGGVKVSDFGLAAVVGADLHRSRLQESLSLAQVTSMETVGSLSVASGSAFAGTILYMSPQALRAETPDPRDDLFSLGVMVYFMLAGRTPAVNYVPVSRMRPGLSRDWDKFIATCLEEERGSRFANATAARHALPRVAGRRPPLLVIAAAVAVLLVGGISFVALKRPELLPVQFSVVKPQTLAFEAIADRLVGAAPFAPVARSSSGLPVLFSVVGGPAHISDSTVTLTGVGLVTIRATQRGNSQFSSAPAVERTFRVAEPDPQIALKSQSIIFEPIPDHVLGDPSFEVFSSATSGLPVTMTVASGPAMATGNAITLTGMGTVTLRCEQSGGAAFLPAPIVERTFQALDAVPSRLVLSLMPDVDITFVRVPAGKMTLGSPETEIGHRSEENRREFSRVESFLMGATEVTQTQYQAITGLRPSYHRRDWKNRPVEQILFSDLAGLPNYPSKGFIAKFNTYLHQHGFSKWEAALPSEDEWEYACRAGSETSYNNGTDLTNPVRDLHASLVAVYGRNETSPVSSLIPNAWGLYDMHGNVAEWTHEGTLRGGSFEDEAVACRSAARLRGHEDDPSSQRRFGFRLILRHVKASKGS